MLLGVVTACGFSHPSTDSTPDGGADGSPEPSTSEIVPSNVDTVGPLEITGLHIAAPIGAFDTNTDCTDTSSLGTCSVATRAGLGEVCVCRLDTLAVDTLAITGSRALAILAHDTVDITTLLDAAGATGTDGPGASRRYPDSRSGAQAGVGGSYATSGGSASGLDASVAFGESTLIPLLGGMRGQPSTGMGGGGGGALQITAGTRISIPGTIDVGGGGGGPGTSSVATSGAGGGGSGGAILLEAPAITMTGALVATGGGGGGGGGNAGSGGAGQRGSLSPGLGGSGRDGDGCPLYGYVSGGNGGGGGDGTTAASDGESSDYDSRCIGSPSFVGAGGGGGGAGRIRINTESGCSCDGTILPRASFGRVERD